MIQIIGLAIIYAILAKCSLSYSFVGPNVSPFFLPIGLALAACILLGNRIWPGIWLGAFSINVLIGCPIASAIVIATGNTIAPALTAWILTKLVRFEPQLTRPNDTLWFFVFGVITCPLASATIGATALCIWDQISWQQWQAAWGVWWLGDATGILLTTPPILGIFTLKNVLPIAIARQVEAWGLVVATFITCILIFGAQLDFAPQNYPIAYLPYPVLIWAAMRFYLIGGTLTSLAVALSAIWGTSRGLGPFHHTNPAIALGLVSTYIIFITSPTLLLTTLFTERKKSQENLQYRADFEHLITTISTRFINIPTDQTDREINQALEDLGRFCNVDRSYVFKLQENTTIADNTHEWCSSWATPQIHNLKNVVLPDQTPWIASKLQHNQPIHIPDTDQLPHQAHRDKKLLQDQEILSLIIVPMSSGGTTIGFLGLDSVRARVSWPPDTITLLTIIGETFVSAMHRQQAEKDLQSAHDQLEERVKQRTFELLESNKRLEQQIIERQQAEQELDRFFDLSPEMLCIAGTDGYFKRINPAFETILGYDRDELLSQPFIEFVHPDDRQKTIDAVSTLSKGVGLDTFENRYRCRDGTYRYLSWVSLPLPHENVVYATARDITYEHQAQEALRDSEHRYRNLFENSPISIWEQDFSQISHWLQSLRDQGVTDLETHLKQNPEDLVHAASLIKTQNINDASIQFYEADSKNHLLQNLTTILQTESYRSLTQELLAIWTGKNSVEHETSGLSLKGHLIHKLVQWGAPTSNGKMDLSKVIVAITDITERKITEQALRQSERLVSIGTLAAGIAHEINNPLGAILINTQVASTKVNDDPKSTALKECLDDIGQQAKRASNIVKGILKFSREQDSNKTPQSPAKALQNACDLTRIYATAMNIPTDLSLPEHLPQIVMNQTEIEQVLVNLIKNAIDASQPDQMVHIRAKMLDDQIQIDVEDHGEGMTHEQVRRAFDPFYSTRHDSSGTGLGLSISHGIITQHNGQIKIKSTQGAGTTVTVLLPIDASANIRH